ncbi:MULTISPECIES: hypothetical protein [Actinoalloteichus]|nr:MULTISPECIES: hypothetical protein [Actinoalloteichus]
MVLRPYWGTDQVVTTARNTVGVPTAAAGEVGMGVPTVFVRLSW